MTAKQWPKPAGRLTQVPPPTPAERAAALEAEAAALALALARNLSDQLATMASDATALANLKSLPEEVRQMAENLRADLAARAESFGKAVGRAESPQS